MFTHVCTLIYESAIQNVIEPVSRTLRLPSCKRIPNEETRKAMSELEAGEGESFASIEELMTDLNADD